MKEIIVAYQGEMTLKGLNRMITPKTELGQCIPEGKTFPLNFD